MRSFPLTAMLALAGMGTLIACSMGASDDSAPMAAGYPSPPNGTGGFTGTPDAAAGGAAGLPPEVEVESSYESPVATGRYVWVANPVSGRVAFIDATTLEVQTTEAGNGPKVLAAVPDPANDVAIVINELSSDATVLRADAEGNLDSATLPIAKGSNTWAISATGRWGIAWTDARFVENPNAAQGFQDITALDLAQGGESSARLSVGYRPVAMSFSADDQFAYAVTQDGISVVDLNASGGPVASRLVAISDDPLEDPGTRDVTITPDGSYAFVRRDGSAAVTVVQLSDGARVDVQLSGSVTDFDLSPDGTRGVAVIRENGEASVLQVPGIFTDPSSFETVQIADAVVGSVAMASASPTALLYSNASDQERVTKLSYDQSPPLTETLRLHAPVLAVFLAPNGASAIVLHNQVQMESSFPGAFSVLNIAPLLPAKIEGTLATPTAVAMTSQGTHAVIAERDDTTKIYGAYLVGMGNQQVDRYELASPPIAVGALEAAKRAFIAQEHPEGRVTFLDLDTGLARTLTGFELGARVVNGTSQ